jgi:predicted RNase H-like nuclease (RuvC/YqgF family)
MNHKVPKPKTKPSEPVKSIAKENEQLKAKITELKKTISGMENKILILQNKYLKLEQKYLILQKKFRKSVQPDDLEKRLTEALERSREHRNLQEKGE